MGCSNNDYIHTAIVVLPPSPYLDLIYKYIYISIGFYFFAISLMVKRASRTPDMISFLGVVHSTGNDLIYMSI